MTGLTFVRPRMGFLSHKYDKFAYYCHYELFLLLWKWSSSANIIFFFWQNRHRRVVFHLPKKFLSCSIVNRLMTSNASILLNFVTEYNGISIARFEITNDLYFNRYTAYSIVRLHFKGSTEVCPENDLFFSLEGPNRENIVWPAADRA